MSVITLASLTGGTVDGTGIFDKLMQAVKAHIQLEYDKGRIKGPEYATLYLGAMQAVLAQAVQFALTQEEANQKVLLMQAEIAKTEQEIVNLGQEKLHTIAQTSLVNQQAANAVTEGEVLTAQKCKLQAEYDLLLAQRTKTLDEADLIVQTKLKTQQETALLSSQVTKSEAEINLLAQKTATEKAQTMALGVDADSVVGRQKALYQAQTTGFSRDAEQKAADILIKSWHVRRTTDEGTVADATNGLLDANIGRVVNKLLTGVGA